MQMAHSSAQLQGRQYGFGQYELFLIVTKGHFDKNAAGLLKR